MSLITVCYRAILRSARSQGWYYPCGIHVHKDEDDVDLDTYLWKHNRDKYEIFHTWGPLPNGVFRSDIHSVLYTLKRNLKTNPLEDEYVDDLLATVREINDLDNWESYLKL